MLSWNLFRPHKETSGKMKIVICLICVCLLVGSNAQTNRMAPARGQMPGQRRGFFNMGPTGNLFAASGMLGNKLMTLHKHTFVISSDF